MSGQHKHQLLQGIGICLSVAGGAFVVYQLVRQTSNVDLELIGDVSLVIALGTFIYAFAVVLLAVAWSFSFPLQQINRATGIDLVLIHAVSQVSKYLPGNIMHFVGRHVLGRQKGLSHASLAMASILEASLLMTAAILLAAMLAPSVVSRLPEGTWISPLWVLCLGIISTVALCLIIWALAARRISVAKLNARTSKRILSAALFMLPFYVVFFACSGGVLYLIVAKLNSGSVDFDIIVGVAAAAWLLGYITPGAPAGVGVREAAISLLLAAAGFPQGAAIAALSYRCCTVLGDVMTWLAGLCIMSLRGKGAPATKLDEKEKVIGG